MINSLTKILSKKMTRKEFLLTLGVLVVGLMGISGFLKSLLSPTIPQKRNKESKRSFGTGSYGV